MSWFSCLAVPASFPCCANVNRTSRWAPKNTTSRQPHSWQLLFMALPKWMGISVQTFHHAPAATHKSHWFPANLHLFYSGRLKRREREKQTERERENIYNDLKDLKRRIGIAFEKDLRNRNRKKEEKKWPIFFFFFLLHFCPSRKWEISISLKWPDLSAYIHKNCTSFHNHPVLSCSVLSSSTLYFIGLCQEGKSNFIIGKIVDLKCLHESLLLLFCNPGCLLSC